MRRTLGQFARYGSVALLATLADWMVFTLVHELGGVAEPGAQALARLTGGVVSFGLNRAWVFGLLEGRGLSGEARRFLTLYAGSYALNLGLLWAALAVTIPTYPAKLLADGACFGVNFLVMRLWVFRGPSAGLGHQPQAEPAEQVGERVR